LKKRLIDTQQIPSSLWCPVNNQLRLPDKLVDLWKILLINNNLLELAKTLAEDGFEGGTSKEDTDKHLAWRYNGSCGRILLSILDPNNKLSEISDAYAQTFAGNRVFLADIPTGSGAALVCILCTFYELRKHNVLPRHPLYITIVAGEISPTATSYLQLQLDDLKEYLSEQAITIDYEVIDWDVLCKLKTTDLIKRLTIKSQNCSSKLLILSNFSGFLANSGKWKKAEPQIDEIFRHSRDTQSIALWIEPQRKTAVTLFGSIKAWFKDKFSNLISKDPLNEDLGNYAQDEVNCIQPIKDGYFPVRLTVVRFDLPIRGKK